mgnify:CR=1 FL=1
MTVYVGAAEHAGWCNTDFIVVWLGLGGADPTSLAILCGMQEAMEALAAAIPAGQLGKVCYKLYEHFRPAWKGWGQKGELSLTGIRGLAGSWESIV